MKGKIRRSISLLLVLAMAMSLLGGSAWAAEAAAADSSAPVAETLEPAEPTDAAEQEEPEQEPAEPVQEPEKEEQAAEEPAQEEEQPVQEQSEPTQAAETSPVTMEESGTCGENLTWKLEGTTLTISGSGDMEDYSSGVKAPWSELTFDTLIIQNNVTRIGENAFSNRTNLKSVTIPDSVKSIGTSAFWECENLNVYISSLSAWCEKTFDSWIGDTYNLYLNDELVTDLVIPNGVTSINAYSFNYCGSLTSVTIPDGVTSIGVCAFDDCKGLKRVMIPGSVTSIGRMAFCWCSNLADVIHPPEYLPENQLPQESGNQYHQLHHKYDDVRSGISHARSLFLQTAALLAIFLQSQGLPFPEAFRLNCRIFPHTDGYQYHASTQPLPE